MFGLGIPHRPITPLPPGIAAGQAFKYPVRRVILASANTVGAVPQIGKLQDVVQDVAGP